MRDTYEMQECGSGTQITFNTYPRTPVTTVTYIDRYCVRITYWDIFSKSIEAALWATKIPSQPLTQVGCPIYIHSDQGENVDGEVIRKFTKFTSNVPDRRCCRTNTDFFRASTPKEYNSDKKLDISRNKMMK